MGTANLKPFKKGQSGNKSRAVYLAARLGHTFDPHCKSCESDLYHTLKYLAK